MTHTDDRQSVLNLCELLNKYELHTDKESVHHYGLRYSA